jgi:hypothetical protein
LSQPLSPSLRGELYAEAGLQSIPWYVPYDLQPYNGKGKIATFDLQRNRVGRGLAYDVSRDTTLRLGVMGGQMSLSVDSARSVNLKGPQASIPLDFSDVSESYGGWRVQWSTDRLDSVSFPTEGYTANLQ